MNTKRILNLMCVLCLLAFTAACSSDDDNKAAELTSGQIAKLLHGAWEVNGNTSISDAIGDRTFKNEYKGIFYFDENGSCLLRITEGTKYNNIYLENYYVNGENYTIIKKDGKNYIFFGRDDQTPIFYFEIVSLSENSLRLVLDQEIFDEDEYLGKATMTIVSVAKHALEE